MSDTPIEYTGTFKTIQDVVDWINNYEPPTSAPAYLLVNEYSESGYYNPGDLTAYEEVLYECISYVYGGEFDPTKWKYIGTIQDQFKSKPGLVTNQSYGCEIFNDLTNNKATGQYSHAEGYYTNAIGQYSHAEGEHCTSWGKDSHSGGSYSESHGNYSFAYGNYAKTGNDYEIALGRFNKTMYAGYDLTNYNAYRNYKKDDIVRYNSDGNIYQAREDLSYGPFDSSKWNVIGTYETSPTTPYLFTVGNGWYEGGRSNAIAVFSDNNIEINGGVIALTGSGLTYNSHNLVTDTEVPPPPSTDGTYTLQCTVSNGVATYAWV